MFKKKPTIKPLAPLRSSDRRKLADQIINDYALEPTTTTTATSPPEQTPELKVEATAARTTLRNRILPDNVQSARFTTTHGPDLKLASGTVYVGHQDGEEPRILWFHINGQMFPSVYTLWANPSIVPLLHTPNLVIKKLQGGADLMTPGLAGGPPFPQAAREGAVVAIAGTDRPTVPVAVGVCKIDIGALEQVQGAKGHAVENVHWAGDELWAYSPGGKPGKQLPDEIECWRKALEGRGLVEKTQDLNLDDQDEKDNAPQQKDEGNDKGKGDAEIEKSSVSVDSPAEMTQKEIDEAFRNAFLYGVYHHKTSNPDERKYGLDFPLTQTVVMTTLVQPFLPAYSPEQAQQMQIKKTSYKTIKKFVKSLDKAKIVKSKDKDGNETLILDIDFEDPAIVDFKPYRLPKKEAVGSAGGAEEVDTGDDSIGQTVQVVISYKPTPKLQPLFDAASGSKTLYTPPEVRELITAYIESENLVSESNKRLIKLNPILGNSLFDGSGSVDKEVLAKGSVPRDALFDRVLHAMSPQHAIVRAGTDPNSVKMKSGAPPKVLITLETRSGNKTVTKVSGLEAYHINARRLAEELRKVCAGATSVEPLAGASQKNGKEVMEVMVQGPQKDAVVKALEKRGVDKRWVELLNKTKPKKR